MAKNKSPQKGKNAQPEKVVKKKAKNTSSINPYILVFGCVFVTFICYIPALNNGWTNWDDQGYVYFNEMTKNLSLSTLPKFFTPPFQMGNYHPLAMLSLAIDCKLFPTEVNGTNLNTDGLATGFHTHSVILHLINVVLVFFFVWTLTKKPWASVITALFFGIHPAHIESVSWVSERKDLLYLLYYVAALIAYLKYIQSGKKLSYYFLAIGLFILSLLSKGQAVTLTVVLVLIDYYLKRPFTKSVWIEKIPFLLLSIVFGVIAIFAQHGAQAIADIPYYSFIDRLIFSADSMFTYFYKALLPFKLSAFYPYPLIVDGHYQWYIFASPVIAALMIAGVIYSTKFGRLLAFSFAFFLVNVILLLQILPVGGAMMADRYTYVAYIGLFFLMGMGVQLAIDNYSPLLSQLKIPFVLLALCATAFFSVKTYSRNFTWKNSESLYLNMLENYSYIPVADNNLGDYYMKHKQPDKAFRYFSDAIKLQPDYKECLINRSDIYRQRGKIDSAIADCDHVLRFAKDYPGAYMNRGIALCIAGRYDSAMHDFNTVLKFDPKNAKAYGNRGNLYDMKGKYDSAIADYYHAIKYDSTYTDVYGNLGRSLLKKGLTDDAIKNLTLALQYDPENPETYALRSDAYNTKGNYRQALNDAQMAIQKGKQINPAYIDLLKQKIKDASPK